jgi:hypothetical protein
LEIKSILEVMLEQEAATYGDATVTAGEEEVWPVGLGHEKSVVSYTLLTFHIEYEWR